MPRSNKRETHFRPPEIVPTGEAPVGPPVAVSTITVKLLHFEGGQGRFETFWSGPISGNVQAVAQILRQAAAQVAQVEQARSPLIIPGRDPFGN